MFFWDYLREPLDELDPLLPLELPLDGAELLEEPDDLEGLIDLVLLELLLLEAEEDFFELLLFFTDALFE